MRYSIVEISKKTGLSSRTLRVWEEAGLLNATRDDNGVRLFAEDIFSLIERIQNLKNFGLSLSDITALFSGKEPGQLRERLLQRREEIEHEALRLSKARQKLQHIEDFLGEQTCSRAYSNFLVTPERAKENALENLLTESGLQKSPAHRSYLQSEFAGLSPEETVAQIALFKRIARYAQTHEIPLHVVRGHASGRLALRLCGWQTADPVAENLYPRHVIQNVPALHFDAPFSNCEHFYTFLRALDDETEHLNLTAFRLPLLDILQDFSVRTGHNALIAEPDERIVALLGSGECEDVFLIDESGDTLVERIYPESSEGHRSPLAVSADLKKWMPKSRLDILRFIAMRREKHMALFAEYLAGKRNAFLEKCKIAQLLAADHRGYVFFHEDMIALISKATHWDLPRILNFRVGLTKDSVSDEDKSDFIIRMDSESYEWVRFWAKKTFCKSHLVGWWVTVAATASCKLRHPQEWISAKKAWEDKNGLAWNNFGVDYLDAKIFTT